MNLGFRFKLTKNSQLSAHLPFQSIAPSCCVDRFAVELFLSVHYFSDNTNTVSIEPLIAATPGERTEGIVTPLPDTCQETRCGRTPVMIPESLGESNGIRLISISPAPASMFIISFSE